MVLSGRSADLLYDARIRLKGLDLDFVSVEALGLPADRAHWHSNSGGPLLRRVFEPLGIGRDSHALDLGSGKGGAALTLATLPFATVTGVELSADLVRIAGDNARKMGLGNVSFIQADAATVRDLDRYTHIYLYNPFPCTVFQEVLVNLTASLSRRPRELTLVYRNPLCSDCLDASGQFEKQREFKHEEHWWFIYRHVPRIAAGK